VQIFFFAHTKNSEESNHKRSVSLIKFYGGIKEINCSKCNVLFNKKGKIKRCPRCVEFSILNLTKKDFFDKRKNWQSAASSIRRSARNIFARSGKELKCYVCNYDKHVEISHRKSVSDFDGETLLIEINDISNLIALCPNHHWEYDNGLLNI